MLRVFALALGVACLASSQQPTSDSTNTGSISGKIVAAGGQPLRKATITLRPTGQGSLGAGLSQGYSTTSDSEGNFTFNNVESGRYQLWGERAGYLRQAYGSKRPNGAGSIVTLTSGREMKDLVIELTPQGVISGKVVDEDGDPVPRTNILLLTYMYANGKRQLMPRGAQMTDDSGEFKVSNLAPGRYYLSAGPGRGLSSNNTVASPDAKSDKPEEAYVTTWYPGTIDRAAAAPIQVLPGQATSGIDIRLRKSAVVHLKGKLVFNGSDTAPQNIRVSLTPRDLGFGASAGAGSPVNQDGSFTLSHVAPGSYTLMAMSLDGKAQVIASQAIEFGERNIDDAVLTVQPVQDLRGAVKVEGDGSAQTNLGAVRVLLQPVDWFPPNIPNAVANSDGTFVLAGVSAGKYRVTALSRASGVYVKAVRYGNQEVPSTGLDLSQGAFGTLEIVFSTKGAEVTGGVQSDGQAVQTGSITLIPDPPSQDTMLYRQTSVDQNGQFTFRGVAPGSYRVYAWEDLEAGLQYDPEFLKPLEGLGTRITAGESGHEQVTLNLISIATVEESRRQSGR